MGGENADGLFSFEKKKRYRESFRDICSLWIKKWCQALPIAQETQYLLLFRPQHNCLWTGTCVEMLNAIPQRGLRPNSRRHAQTRCGGPCRGRSYSPLITRCPVAETPGTQEHVSKQKNKKSDSSILSKISLGWALPVTVW